MPSTSLVGRQDHGMQLHGGIAPFVLVGRNPVVCKRLIKLVKPPPMQSVGRNSPRVLPQALVEVVNFAQAPDARTRHRLQSTDAKGDSMGKAIGRISPMRIRDAPDAYSSSRYAPASATQWSNAGV